MDQREATELARDGAVSVRAACEFLGIGRTQLYQLMASGQLRFVKLGSRRLVLRREMQRYLVVVVQAALG
jgi:excisionase family DNA binding protein